MLHLLGIDHKKLTYRFNGRDMRLTDVYGTLDSADRERLMRTRRAVAVVVTAVGPPFHWSPSCQERSSCLAQRIAP